MERQTQPTPRCAGDTEFERREAGSRAARGWSAEIALQLHDDARRGRNKALLKQLGCRVRAVDSPKRLLELLEAGHRFDLALIDLDSPCGTALQVAHIVASLDPSMVLIGTGRESASRTIVEFLRAGGSDFVAPVLDEVEWADRLMPLLERRGVAEVQPDPLPEGAVQEVIRTLDTVADTDVPVLLHGETGVGKGMVARIFHARSSRRDEPFVQVLCTAIPRNLLETELFGYARGAFTGAVESRAGRFEQARGGILLLDEIGDLDLGLQAKLLHVLDGGEFSRVGCNRLRRSRAQIVCATNVDLARMVEEGRFRRDLYHRINVVAVRIPPLRERREEIRPLFLHFVHEAARALHRPAPRPSRGLLGLLEQHPYPGNVRELQNLARRFVIFGREDGVVREILAARGRRAGRELEVLCDEAERNAGGVRLLDVGRRASETVEAELIEQALISTGWNRRRASRLLGMSYATLLQKIVRFELAGAR